MKPPKRRAIEKRPPASTATTDDDPADVVRDYTPRRVDRAVSTARSINRPDTTARVQKWASRAVDASIQRTLTSFINRRLAPFLDRPGLVLVAGGTRMRQGT